MKLQTTITTPAHVFTQVKRNDKAAIYRRETSSGHFESFDVFAIRTKDGVEVYPNHTAVENKWCFQPVSESRANVWFERFTNGDIIVPNVDPVTGEALNTDERSLDELPDAEIPVENVAPVPASIVVENILPADVVDVPTGELKVVTLVPTVEDPTAPEPIVSSTPDGGVIVTVAKVRDSKVYPTIKLPAGEFVRNDFAELNGFDHHPAHSDSYGPLMKEIKEGRVVELRKEQRGRGRPVSIYTAVTEKAA